MGRNLEWGKGAGWVVELSVELGIAEAPAVLVRSMGQWMGIGVWMDGWGGRSSKLISRWSKPTFHRGRLIFSMIERDFW